jgi:hypothetical protein
LIVGVELSTKPGADEMLTNFQHFAAQLGIKVLLSGPQLSLELLD